VTALLGQGVLLAWFDVNPAVRAEHDRWYLHEHMPERISVPGFLRARRYGDGRHLFVIYETVDLDVLTSPAYMARLNAPTAATQRLAQTALNSVRIAATPVISCGNGCGGWVTTTQLRGVRDPGRFALYAQRALDREPNLIAVHLFRAVEEVTMEKKNTVEAGVAPDSGLIPWVLVVEGASDIRASTTALLVLLGEEYEAATTESFCYQHGLFQQLDPLDDCCVSV
jgi:hypothetical protein